MQTRPDPPRFPSLGIAPAFLDILERLQFTVPTPIQHASIPVAIQGKDIIGIAQTGTGKTLAFGLPMVQRLLQGKGRGLIIVPTRELAFQVDETVRLFALPFGIKTAIFVGGASMHLQKQMLRENPRILIATPGRLIDHLQQRTITLKEVSILVLDEADRMLDMGFAPQVNKILQHVPKERQTMLFSATMPVDIVRLATSHMKLPLRIEVAPPGTAAEKVEQELFIVRKDQKMQLLEKVLVEHPGTVLLFSRTKYGARKITRQVRAMGHSAAEIHSDRSLPQRREALEGFKTGKYRVLVATDIAARGIDVTGISLVLNFDLPQNAEDYVHRIGRTGRAGMEGHAISFAMPDQLSEVKSIERLIRIQLPRTSLPQLPPARTPPPPEQQQPGRSFGGEHRGQRRGTPGSHGRRSTGRGNRHGGERRFGR